MTEINSHSALHSVFNGILNLSWPDLLSYWSKDPYCLQVLVQTLYLAPAICALYDEPLKYPYQWNISFQGLLHTVDTIFCFSYAWSEYSMVSANDQCIQQKKQMCCCWSLLTVHKTQNNMTIACFSHYKDGESKKDRVMGERVCFPQASQSGFRSHTFNY